MSLVLRILSKQVSGAKLHKYKKASAKYTLFFHTWMNINAPTCLSTCYKQLGFDLERSWFTFIYIANESNLILGLILIILHL